MSLLPIILASSSVTRKKQLSSIGLDFTISSPDIDESALPNESPHDLVNRLSINKAKVVGERNPGCLIIAGDQVLAVGKTILGKPKGKNEAGLQLNCCSGKNAIFYTGVCLHNSKSNEVCSKIITTQVKFKKLSAEMIESYLCLDQPYDCAGSIQIESRGMLLLESVSSNDPFAVLGLPLTILNELFTREKINLLTSYCTDFANK